MPRVAVDKNGNFYETDSNRADGLGYGRSPVPVQEGDLTYGSAFKKAADRRRASNANEFSYTQKQKYHDEQKALVQKRNNQIRAAQEQEKNRILTHPTMQNRMIKEAHRRKAKAMGCDCAVSTPVSGNGLTSNGMLGYNGMSRDQRAIHNFVTGKGMDVSARISPVEREQMLAKARAMEILKAKADQKELARVSQVKRDRAFGR